MCVKLMGSVSDLFESKFQGEITSPILFLLFLNDIKMHLQENINKYLLLFADDAVLLSEDAQGLQQMLDRLHGYYNKWSLTVNVDKTKILVFRKGGRLPQKQL